LGLVPTPTSVNGEPPDDETVVLGEGAILAQGVGTMRTMKQEPELEATAIATFQNKPIFPPASLADVYGEGGEEGVALCRITDARPLYVWDMHKNGADPQQPGVGGLLYFANLTCCSDPFLILSQFTMRHHAPAFIKLLQLISDRDLKLKEVVEMDKRVRGSINISSRFVSSLIFAAEWGYGWELVDREEALKHPNADSMTACRCRWGLKDHSNDQK
jgi:hypothetical protein